MCLREEAQSKQITWWWYWDSFRWHQRQSSYSYGRNNRPQKSKNCFDDNDEAINELLAQRHSSHSEHLADTTNMIKRSRYLNLKSTVQRKLKQIKDWFKRKAELFQHYAYNNDIRHFYYEMKTLYGPSSNAKTPICDRDGKLLIDIDAINFEQLLNWSLQISQEMMK